MRVTLTVVASVLCLVFGDPTPGIPPRAGQQPDSGSTRTREYRTRVDIPGEARSELIRMLNRHLAMTADLRSQLKQAHWNVKGEESWQLHLLFDEIAAELIEFEDMLAERVTSLGGYARGTVRMAAESSPLPEYPTDLVGSPEHVEAMADRVGMYADHVREATVKTDELGDLATSDLYADISRTMDKRLWFLEAHHQDR